MPEVDPKYESLENGYFVIVYKSGEGAQECFRFFDGHNWIDSEIYLGAGTKIRLVAV